MGGVKVTRRFLVLLLLAVAIPATAQTFGLSIGTSEPAPCLALGNLTYRLAAAGARADYTVRIDASALSPDIRIQLSDTPDEADLVLVDDGEKPAKCGAGAAIKSVKIDAQATAPDLTIGFAALSAPADYRIYVRSGVLEPMAAAALFAASRTAAHKSADRTGSFKLNGSR
jgi:hypothetical protein